MISATHPTQHYGTAQYAATAKSGTGGIESAAEKAESDTAALSSRTQRLLAARGLTTQQRAGLDALLQRAAEPQATQDPVSFLKSLSTEELSLLQKAHALADPVKVSELSTEGAANLLRYPGDGIDIDNDGFVSYGKARIFQFPPSGAPQGVKQAWEEATKGMSDLERVSAEGMFLPIMLGVDEAGNVSPRQPGDPDYVAPYSGDFSYLDLVQQRLESLEVTRKFGAISDEQYARDRAFLERFGNALTEQGVA